MAAKTVVIEPLVNVPAVAAIRKRLADFDARLQTIDARREEIAAELAVRRRRQDPQVAAARLRAGEQVNFTIADATAFELEAGALAVEADAIDAAVAQDDRALEEAVTRASADLTDKLKPRLAEIDRQTAAAFESFAKVRAEGSALALDAIGAGYSALGMDIAASALFPTLGSLGEHDSPVSLMLRHLIDRGLVKG